MEVETDRKIILNLALKMKIYSLGISFVRVEKINVLINSILDIYLKEKILAIKNVLILLETIIDFLETITKFTSIQC